MPSPRLTKVKVQKTRRLLDMMYKPAEIAEELDIVVDTIHRSYLPAGAPCEKDTKGRVWIHGESFARWARVYLSAQAVARHVEMQDDQAWCCHCNQAVQLQDFHTSRPNGHGVANRHGKCPACGGKVNRFIKAELKRKVERASV